MAYSYWDEMDRLRNNANTKISVAWRRHERLWKDNRYVYPVISRRSRGLSIGINLNPDKTCNFKCIYCQVNRSRPAASRGIDLKAVAAELDAILRAERDRSLYENVPYDCLDDAERGVRDIALSGDGEPTLCRRFGEAIQIMASARQRFGLDSAKLVLITNAAYLHRHVVRKALSVLDQNNGEIWAKLDAGTEEFFRRVNRANVPLQRIISNILEASQIRPLVIQSLWFRIHDAAPPEEEVEAYCDRLKGILAAGGRLKLVQLYTIARYPADSSVTALTNEELEHIASVIRARVSVPVEAFRGL